MSSHSRENGLRTTLENGDVALGVLDGLFNPTLVELYGDLGVDFVWLDYEHAGPSVDDAERLENLLRAADASGTELLVRIPTPSPALVRKVLDAGARNVFVSRVETAEDVRRVVSAARFSYEDGPGERGLAAPRASRWGLEMEEYPSIEDREVVVGATIETAAAVENLEEILAVPDLGFAFAGPNDLSVAAGHPGQRDHPEVEESVEAIRETCLERGVPVGNLTSGVDDAVAKAEAGYQILNAGSTFGALTAHFQSWFDQFEADAGE